MLLMGAFTASDRQPILAKYGPLQLACGIQKSQAVIHCISTPQDPSKDGARGRTLDLMHTVKSTSFINGLGLFQAYRPGPADRN